MLFRATSENANLSRLIEKQLRNWEINKSQERPTRPCQGLDVCDFVTVSNIAGAGGHELVTRLSERLGWSVFHREILSEMAGDDDIQVRLYKSMDERDLGWVENTFRSLMQAEFRKNDYFHQLTKTILLLARRGPSIFVGRCADLILPKSKGLRIKVIASLAYCAKSFAEFNDVPIDQAMREVERIEAERRLFVKNHFKLDAHESSRFDLLLNIERFDIDQSLELILQAMQLCRINGRLAQSPA